jgi:site-specific DNA-methyltransferase (adenine-specific)
MAVTILEGDCRESLRTLPYKSVHCCVTSPPYFGLRDYGVEGQLGLEQTPDQYVAELVSVFREVHNVLKDDGTVWLNIGDSYASFRDGKATPDTTRGDSLGTLVDTGKAKNRMASTFVNTPIKHKDLIGIPWKVAFALQADGWYLRQDIIWNKPNPMPESVKDRCTKSHEYIFLLSKSEKYYFDYEAIKEPATTSPTSRNKAAEGYQADYPHGDRFSEGERVWGADGKRNKRSVWNVPLRPYKGAHFATFPMDLIEPCILAGCPVGGTVLDPFGGAGTTAIVSNNNDRNSILCELNPEYVELAKNRIASEEKIQRIKTPTTTLEQFFS